MEKTIQNKTQITSYPGRAPLSHHHSGAGKLRIIFYFMNNLSQNQNQELFSQPSLKPRPSKLKKFIYIFIFLFVAFISFSSKAPNSDEANESWIYKIPIIGQIKHLAESADKKLKGQDDDRINILLLGMGGQAHQGGYLTDTIMLASLEPSSQKAALLSIPRDLSVPLEGLGWRKINNINAFAEAENSGSGGLAVSQALSDILEIPVDYYFRMDFAGFVNIIDELGGIKINVENVIDDKSYPIMGMEEAEPYEDRFEYLYIPAGWQKMDGELALKYVRSRHSAGIEGSDFARSRRQQKVMEAVKEKLLSKYILFKPRLITNIINQLQDHVSTNLKIWEMLKLWDIAKKIDKENIINKGLDNSPSGLLLDIITQEGAYVLNPRSGDFAEIQYLVHNIFSDVPYEFKAKVTVEKSSIEIRNGTWINGLASQTALDLEKYGFNIVRIVNSGRQNSQKSVIYDLTFGGKLESLAILKEKTGANVSFELPSWLYEDISKEVADEKNPVMPDFILILGQDADKSGSGAVNIEE